MIATCKSKRLIALVAAMLSLFMLMTLCAVSASATEAEASTETTVESTTETTVESTTETTAQTTAQTTAGTTAGTTATTETEHVHEHDTVSGLINLGVGALILIVLAILAVKFKDKIPGWWKALKSECGKISWCSGDKLKKNTFVVVIIILAIVIAIAVLDFVFSRGVSFLIDLF